jgi:DNA-binding transcriptional ArsR family regulator
MAPHKIERSTMDRSHSNAATNERASNSAPDSRAAPRRAAQASRDIANHLRKRLPDEDRLKRIRTVFAMLADRQRLKIVLGLTAADELCVGEVAHMLRVSVSVASHHLRKMRDVGVLEDREAGKLAYYSLRQRSVAKLAVAALGVVRA